LPTEAAQAKALQEKTNPQKNWKEKMIWEYKLVHESELVPRLFATLAPDRWEFCGCGNRYGVFKRPVL